MKNLFVVFSTLLLSLNLLSCHKDDPTSNPSPANDTALSNGYWRLAHIKWIDSAGTEHILVRNITYRYTDKDSGNRIITKPMPDMAYTIRFTFNNEESTAGTFTSSLIKSTNTGTFVTGKQSTFIENFTPNNTIEDVEPDLWPSVAPGYLYGISYIIDMDGKLNITSYPGEGGSVYVFEKKH